MLFTIAGSQFGTVQIDSPSSTAGSGPHQGETSCDPFSVTFSGFVNHGGFADGAYWCGTLASISATVTE